MLNGPLVDQRFGPNAILCVSHGKLNGFFAGSIGAYEIFHKVKVLSLWGARDLREIEGSPNMFDNKVNRHILQGLKAETGRKRITLLLTDYKVESGKTACQAIGFITNILGENIDIIFCPMFCKNKETFIQSKIMLDGEKFRHLQDYLPFNYKNKYGKGLGITEDFFYDTICVGDNIPEHPLDW